MISTGPCKKKMSNNTDHRNRTGVDLIPWTLAQIDSKATSIRMSFCYNRQLKTYTKLRCLGVEE